MVVQSSSSRQITKKRVLHASNSENTPPVKLRRVSTSIREASRRRRARVTSGTNPSLVTQKAKYAYDLKYRKAKPTFGARLRFRVELSRLPSAVLAQVGVQNMEMTESKSSAVNSAGMGPAIRQTTATLPRHLPRPDFKDIDKNTLAAIEPEFADTPIEYIQEGLASIGHDMYKVLVGAKPESVTNTLPKELTIVVNDLSSEMPSHVLAVYAQPSARLPPSRRNKVKLYPSHNVILAAHCANLPPLSARSQPAPDTPGSSITVPVVPLCIPEPELFNPLSLYLYTKRVESLLQVFLPVLPSVPLDVYVSANESSDEAKKQREGLLGFARGLAFTYTSNVLLCYAMRVNSFWRNVCALGIFENQLWAAMDFAWEILVLAMAVSTGNVEHVTEEQAVAQPVGMEQQDRLPGN